MTDHHGRDEGLAAERTGLGWTRTSLGALANGALVILRHRQGQPDGWMVALLVAAGLVAVGAWVAGARRDHELKRSPVPKEPARAWVLTTGVAVMVLCCLWLAALLTSVWGRSLPG